MLHINLQMVLQVFSNSWEFLNYFDTQGLKFIQVPNARQLQKLRRIEGASKGDDFSTLNAYCLPFVAEVQTYSPVSLETDAQCVGTAHYFEVTTMHNWMKISSSCAETSTPENVFIKSTKAFLTETIQIVCQFKTSLLDCLEKSFK